MLKSTVFAVPAVLGMAPPAFAAKLEVPAETFAQWQDDDDDVPKKVVRRVQKLLADEHQLGGVLEAFAKPFFELGFTEKREGSDDEESLSHQHARLEGLSLSISEDGYQVGDERQSMRLDEVFALTDWQELHALCKALLDNSTTLNEFLLGWAQDVPGATPESTARLEGYVANLQRKEIRKQVAASEDAKLLASIREQAEAGDPTAAYNLGLSYLQGTFGNTVDVELAERWLAVAAAEPGNVARLARTLLGRLRAQRG
ncbi:MAG: hypothetical protein IPI49_29525 [Myxococcales bacterium]|nr:hypothetical protein [Myxococcales bacterium]